MEESEKSFIIASINIVIEAEKEEEKKAEADNNLYNEYDVWEKVEIARSSERPNAADYIEKITKDFCSLVTSTIHFNFSFTCALY